jgi:hypothetical protein
MSSDPRQKLLDAFQVSVPLVQRILLTLRQQTEDAVAVLAALERGVTIARAWAPSLDRQVERATASLELSIYRAGHSFQEVSFLSAVQESRLRQLIAGDVPTPEERDRLKAVLPDWRPGQ